jgi:nucleoside-diphosphate-sugar epimerase
MRVLVTGHRGFIGCVMTPFLLREGFEVVGLDSGLFAECRFGGPSEGDDLPSIDKDVRDVTGEDLDGFEAVVHLANLSNDPLGNLDPALTNEINFLASVRLAQLAREAGARRFLFSSSCSYYGAGGEDFLTEEATPNPVTPYAVAKIGVEQALSELARPGFSPCYLRNATAYGVSSCLRLDLVLNNLVAWAFTTGRVLLKSDGTPWRPLVHIEDITRAFVAALRAPVELIHDQAFNVGRSEENYRIRELAEIVAQEVPGSRVEIAGGAGPDKRHYRVDCDKLQRTLPEFRPQWDARRGARELHAAFREHGLSRQHLEGPDYIRLAHLESLLEQKKLRPDLRWAAG